MHIGKFDRFSGKWCYRKIVILNDFENTPILNLQKRNKLEKLISMGINYFFQEKNRNFKWKMFLSILIALVRAFKAGVKKIYYIRNNPNRCRSL